MSRWWLGAALALLSCSAEIQSDAAAGSDPVAIDGQEGAVCGMVVREQSAPRAQVVHRDGHRAFLCSIGDLLAYLHAPSPHGAPREVLVEVMRPDEDPMEIHLGPHPWAPAADVFFVVGIPRRSIMGEPVLVYDTEEDARSVAGTRGEVLRFAGLERWWLGLGQGGHE